MLPSRMFFDSFLDDFNDDRFNKKMKCDIYEEDNKYNIIMDVPGYSKEDINIECDNGVIKIVCEKNSESTEDEDKKYYRRERNFERCERTFNFGDINEEEIVAEYKNGTLKLIIPMKEKIETKKNIEIR